MTQLHAHEGSYNDPQVAVLVSMFASVGAKGDSPREGLRPDSRDVDAFSEGLDELAEGLRQAGIVNVLPRPVAEDQATVDAWLRSVGVVLAWRILPGSLGLELAARLLGTSVSSARRYRKGTRPTPDRVAARLPFLVLVVEDLKGAYTDAGIQRWFDRKRTALGGRAPADLLRGDWMPGETGPEQVRGLAMELQFSPAT